jgi:hypothetical protein
LLKFIVRCGIDRCADLQADKASKESLLTWVGCKEDQKIAELEYVLAETKYLYACNNLGMHPVEADEVLRSLLSVIGDQEGMVTLKIVEEK